MLPKGPDTSLILCWVSAEGKPGVNEVPGLLGYPLGSPTLALGQLGKFPSNLREYFIFPRQCIGWA